MNRLSFFILLLTPLFFMSCNKDKVAKLEKEVSLKDEQIQLLESQLEQAQVTTNSLLDRMSDLSIVNKEGAQSIRKSLENITQQYSFIEDLTAKVQSKDSLNLALVMNLKRSLNDINDEDVEIEVKGGIVYVSISDKLLFSPGSSKVSDEAEEVLGKVASVINDHDALNVLVEGHTDNKPIANSCVKDNWDLSTKRATEIVRILQNEHFVAPERLTAAGRSSYLPKMDNDTEEGRAKNRRTEILIMPRFDQFFALMESPDLMN